MKSLFIDSEYRSAQKFKSNHNSIKESINNSSYFFIFSKYDNCAEAFIKDLEKKSKKLNLLHYENLGKTWTFSYFKKILSIHFKNEKIILKSIYHRHPGLSNDLPNPTLHLVWLEALENWNGLVIGQKKKHFHNSSKIFQSITSIKQAQQKSALDIKTPKSYFVKGRSALQWLDENKDFVIVKSASSWRSQVVDKGNFQDWNTKGLLNLPTLFQDKLVGEELRIHFLNNYYWSLSILQKIGCDYRYGGETKYLEKDINEKIKLFCKNISLEEKNSLVGIDLFLTTKGTFCLECNPGPGWGSFHHESRKKFSNKLFQVLTN